MRFPWNRQSDGGVRLIFVASDDESASPSDPEPLDLPSTMQHLNVVAKRRFAALFFAFHSTTEVLILSFVPLALRFAGISIFASASLLATSTVLSVLLSSLILTCVRCPSKRKFLGGLAIFMAILPLGGLIHTLRPMNLRYIPAEIVQQSNVSFIRPSFPLWENDNCETTSLWPGFSPKETNSSDLSPAEIGSLANTSEVSSPVTVINASPAETTFTNPSAYPIDPSTGVPIEQIPLDTHTRVSNVPPLFIPETTPNFIPSEVPSKSPISYEPRRPTVPQPIQDISQPIPNRPEWLQNALDSATGIPNIVRTRRDATVYGMPVANNPVAQNFDRNYLTSAGNSYAINNEMVAPNEFQQQPMFMGGQLPVAVREPRRPQPFIADTPMFSASAGDPTSEYRQVNDFPQNVPSEKETRVERIVPDRQAVPATYANDDLNSNGTVVNVTDSSVNATDNFWTRINGQLEATSVPGFYLVMLVMLTLFETFFKLVRQVCDGLYRDYLDQLDFSEKAADHLPFVHGATVLLLGLIAATVGHFRCELLPVIGDPSVMFISFAGIPLIFALIIFHQFPVPAKQSHLKVEPVSPNKINVFNNARAFLLAATLVVLGSTLGAEQSIVLWRLISLKADFIFILCFIAIPILTSAVLVKANHLRRIGVIRRFLMIALVTVQIRFVIYACLTEYGRENSYLYWLLPIQILMPFGTTFVWNAIDNFSQKVTFPHDDGSLRRQFHFAYWVLGLSGGTLLAGYGYDRFGFLLTFTSLGISSGIWAIVLLGLTQLLPLHQMSSSNSLRYSKLRDREEEISSKRPINNFQEVDESDADEDTVEFEAPTGISRATATRTENR